MINIKVITGMRGAGKTSFVKETAKLMPDAIGVIAEKCLGLDGAVLGYDAVLIPNGERMPLCRRLPDAQFAMKHGGFWFDNTVFDRVEAYILSHFDGHRPVVIDEIGSLEMKHHQGYFPLLVKLLQYPDIQLIITLRA